MYFFNPRTDAGWWIATTAERTGTASLQVAHTKVFDTDTQTLYVYNGSSWIALGDPGIVAGTQLSGLLSGGVTTAHLHNHSALNDVTAVMAHVLKYKKTSDQTVTNSAVLVNDSALVHALAANDFVSFTLHLRYEAVAAADFKCAFTVPAAATVSYEVVGPDQNDNLSQQAGVASADALALGGGGAATTRVVTITGSVVNGANAGNLQFQFAQNTQHASDAKTLAGSWLAVVKM